MRKNHTWIAQLLATLGVLILLISLVAVFCDRNKAQAAVASGVCQGSGGAAKAPQALVSGRFVLRNTKTTGYTGKPFSYRLLMARGGFPAGEISYRWMTYDVGYANSAITGPHLSGRAVLVQTWCGGRRGADWVGNVASR